MNSHIVHNTRNNASRFPQRLLHFSTSHSLTHPHPSNENIDSTRNTAIWPARSRQPAPVIGLHVKGRWKPSSPDYMDV